MFDKDNWQEIISALSKNKLRSFLTAFGVFWGIFMLIIMLGSGNGLRNGVSQDMGDFATNSMFLWSQRTSIPYKGFVRGRWFWLKTDDVQAIYDNVPEAKIVSPRNQLGGWRGGNNVTRGLKTGAFGVYGDYPEYNIIEPKNIVQGRFINQLDIEQKRKVAVIGEAVYQYLFEPGEDPIDQHVMINGVYFKVVGLYKSKKKGENAIEDTQAITVPFTTFQQAFNYGENLGWMALLSQPDVKVSEMEEKVIALLKERHTVHPDDTRAFGSENLEEQFGRMSNLFLAIKLLSFFVGILTLFAGVIGISNIMLVVVKERTKEIGIRRALGATPFNIIQQIMLEAATLTTIAGMAGLVFGVWLLEAISTLLAKFEMDTGSFAQPEVDISVALIALLILVVSGLLAGIIPAKRAVQIKPVDAIREE
jgi:putative ABC transport system permease protein